ncbi:hypothetical protein O5470_10810 [Escherichia coli]|nr:hypothetical protein [Escherichia coli]
MSLTNENGSHSVFSYDALDRLVQQSRAALTGGRNVIIMT